MPPLLRDQQKHWPQATPVYFGIAKGLVTGLNITHKVLGRERHFFWLARLGKPFALLPF